MGREGRVDALLDLRLSSGGSGTVTPSEEADDVVSALAAADRLIGLRSVEPNRLFALDLETQLLARAGALAVTTPAAETAADRQDTRSRGPVTHLASWWRVGRRGRSLWPIVAAASLALVLGVGTLSVVVEEAGPGSPLYALHRWELGVQVQLAGSPAEKAQLHLQNARDALNALNVAVEHHEGDPVYSDALATLTAEDHDAATTVAALPSGAEHTSLAAQLDSLHQQEIPDLYAALPVIGWNDQLATTQALGNLGAVVPRVTAVTLEQTGSGVSRGWRVTITGSGFEPGAELVGRGGTVIGQVISGGSIQLVVDITSSERHLLTKDAGVRNPDSTAAALARLTDDSNGQGTGPSTQKTPTSSPHGGGHEPTPSPGTPKG